MAEIHQSPLYETKEDVYHDEAPKPVDMAPNEMNHMRNVSLGIMTLLLMIRLHWPMR
jgi:hypothetical protein